MYNAAKSGLFNQPVPPSSEHKRRRGTSVDSCLCVLKGLPDQSLTVIDESKKLFLCRCPAQKQRLRKQFSRSFLTLWFHRGIKQHFFERNFLCLALVFQVAGLPAVLGVRVLRIHGVPRLPAVHRVPVLRPPAVRRVRALRPPVVLRVRVRRLIIHPLRVVLVWIIALMIAISRKTHIRSFLFDTMTVRFK